MSVKIEVKSCDDGAKVRRRAVAQSVLDVFGNGLPDLKLLAFFDDKDWQPFKDHWGKENRGFYRPIKEGIFQSPIWPSDAMQCIFVDDDDPSSSLPLKQDVDHVIYLHGSTCAGEVGLIMTFSHELQHFIQYGFNRKLWAENLLLPHLPREVIDITGLNWPDFPAEREARTVAKRTGMKLCGADAVNKYIDRRISESITQKEVDDWRFSQRVDPSISYDLAGETRRIFQRLKPFRQHLEELLDQQGADADFKNLDLAEYFDDADDHAVRLG
jgi:hypothetical protein